MHHAGGEPFFTEDGKCSFFAKRLLQTCVLPEQITIILYLGTECSKVWISIICQLQSNITAFG